MEGKTIVVTGGTKGIGRAVIQVFIQNGYHVITCSRNNEDLMTLKKDMESEFPNGHVDVCQADLSQRTDVDKFIKFVGDNTSGVDVLVNNTGVFVPGELRNEEEGSLEHMMNTNLYSAYHLTRGLLNEMIQKKSGYIFNMCSVASIKAYPNGGSYSISKFALYGFTKVLREELKEHNIRVSAVLPGATYTASWEGVDIPEERFMKARDVAEAVWSANAMSTNSVVEEIIIRPQLGDL